VITQPRKEIAPGGHVSRRARRRRRWPIGYAVVHAVRKVQRILGPAVFGALLLLVALYWITVGVVFVAEHGRNPSFGTFRSALYWVFLKVVDSAPWEVQTTAGKLMDYTVGVLKPITIAVVTAALTSHLFQMIVRRGSGMGRTRVKNHIVICGWSSKGAEILREIRSREDEGHHPVVILAQLSASPASDDYTTFVAGDPTSSDDLKRAGIERADVAIVLADNSYDEIDAEEMDSRTLLSTLAIESLNPDCYTCVEVVHSANREHFSRTKADELVVSAHLTGALLAHSAIARGLSRVLDDLLTYPEGDEFYWVEIPPIWHGRSFADAMSELKTGYDCLPISVSRNGTYTTNPPAPFQLEKGDRLLVLAKTEPVIA
jgi:voltage-gated potassium channel